MTIQQKNILLLTVKALIAVLLCWILLNRLTHDFEKISVDYFKTKINKDNSLVYLLAAVLLMPLNWFIEAIKWRLLLSTQIASISIWNSYKSVLTGVAFGNLSPGRATEFTGKIIFVDSKNRIKASVLHFIGGSTQLMITLIFGVSALMGYKFQYSDIENFRIPFFLFSIGLALFLLIFITKPDVFFHLLGKLPFVKKTERQHIILQPYVLLKLFMFSLIRHLVFSAQYFLLILIFFEHPDDLNLLYGIFISLLLTSIVPMFSPVEALMRGGIGILVFGSLELNSVNIFALSVAVWVINILLPSLPGLIIFLIRRKNNMLSRTKILK